jgi:hypothetical protein
MECHISLSTVTYPCPLSHIPVHCHIPLSTVTYPCPLSHTTVHCHISLSTVTYHCPLSHTTVHCHIPLSHTPVHCHIPLSTVMHILFPNNLTISTKFGMEGARYRVNNKPCHINYLISVARTECNVMQHK